MTVDCRRELADKAHKLALNGKFSEAGDIYVQAGFEETGQFFGLSSRGIELRMFFKACLCYRLAGEENRCKFVANFAIVLAEEYIARAKERPKPSQSFDRVKQGAWHEFIADFQRIAGFADSSEAYNRAKAIYKQEGDPLANFGEGPIRSAQAIFDDVALHAGVDEEIVIEATKGTLTEWVDYKREHFPELIEILLSSEEWLGP